MDKERSLVNRYAKAIEDLTNIADRNIIDPELYTINDVKRGLRDKDGKGVLCGLT